MKLEVMDTLNELEIKQKEAKAILDGFMSQFVHAEKKINLISIESCYDRYQYTAHVMCDLLYDAIQQTAELEKLLNAEQQEKAV